MWLLPFAYFVTRECRGEREISKPSTIPLFIAKSCQTCTECPFRHFAYFPVPVIPSIWLCKFKLCDYLQLKFEFCAVYNFIMITLHCPALITSYFHYELSSVYEYCFGNSSLPVVSNLNISLNDTGLCFVSASAKFPWIHFRISSSSNSYDLHSMSKPVLPLMECLNRIIQALRVYVICLLGNIVYITSFKW